MPQIGKSTEIIERQWSVAEFWAALSGTVIAVSTTATDKNLPNVVVAGLPSGATVRRAIILFRVFRVRDTASASGGPDGDQYISVDSSSARSSVVNGLTIPDDAWRALDNVAYTEPPVFFEGETDVSSEVTGNGTYYLTWELAKADYNTHQVKTYQVGLRIWWN